MPPLAQRSRNWPRLKKNQASEEELETLREAYETAKKDLGNAVSKAEKALAEALNAKPPNIDAVTTAKNALKTAETELGGLDSGPLDETAYLGSEANKTGLYALEKADLFNLLCIPPDTRGGDTSTPAYQTAMAYCKKRRAMLIVDAPAPPPP